MNLKADHLAFRLKWCQPYKNQNWDLTISSDETVFSEFWKVNRNGCRKKQYLAIQKL